VIPAGAGVHRSKLSKIKIKVRFSYMKIRNIAASLFIAAAVLTLSGAAAAKDQWLQVRSKNFFLIGNASEKDIRKVATRLEQFRETFRQVFRSANLVSSVPTNVIVFRSDPDYKPFKPRRPDGKADNFIAGYFQPGEDVNYITLSAAGDDADMFGTIFHEYVHFIVNSNFGKADVPPWFNEGLAEYYQTFAIAEDQKVKLGLPQSIHLSLLLQSKMIPLETLFGISNASLHLRGDHSRSIFYAESWALMHYLIQGGKTEALNKFLTAVLKDVPAKKAFEDSFGVTYQQMEVELKKYILQSKYKYIEIAFKKKLVFDAEMQVSPLPDADTNAYLGDLLYHTNRADDAEAYLQKALALQADSSMANTTLGMVKLRQRKYDEAKGYLEKAISEDQKNHLALYRYAYLLSREGRDEFGYVRSFPGDQAAKMRELLKRAIAIAPAFTESYELLAFISIVDNEQLDEAIGYLNKALALQPGNERYKLRIAEIYLRQKKFAEAAAIAEKLAASSDDPEVRTRSGELAASLKQAQEVLAKNEELRRQYGTSANSGSSSGGPPVLIRRGTVEPTAEELNKASELAVLASINSQLPMPQEGEKRELGRIEKIDCSRNGIIVYTIKTAAESFQLSSKDFQGLELRAFSDDTVNNEVGCDAKLGNVNVVVNYKAGPDAKKLIRGELTSIAFVPANFRFIDAGSVPDHTDTPAAAGAPPESGDKAMDAQRQAAMMNAIKQALRQPEAGEKREMGFVDKLECGQKGSFFYLRGASATLKLAVESPQSVKIRGFTPEIQDVQMGCSMKALDIPVVFIYKVAADVRAKSAGQLVSLEFVPRSFVLKEE
jgi:tetratricopeptide (TPR) repeat protein